MLTIEHLTRVQQALVMRDRDMDDQQFQARLRKAQKQNIELLAELEVTHKLISRLRAERNLILDRVYKEEVAPLEVYSSSEDEADEKLVDWADLESSFIRRGLVAKPSAASSTSTATIGTKRRPSTTNGHAPSPKKAATEQKSPEIKAEASGPLDAMPSSQVSATAAAGAKPKRTIKTAEAAAAVPRKAHSVPLDPEGHPILPVTCGIVTVHDLGTIVPDRPNFHTKRYIWPVGYHSSRQYLSTVDSNTQATYHSTILDGPNGPVFDVYAEDNPEEHYQSSSSTGVWSTIVKLANSIRGKEYSNSASGPDFYGFSNATIAMMIETLLGVESCINYQRKSFEVTSLPKGGKSIASHSSAAPSSSLPNEVDEDEEAVNVEEQSVEYPDPEQSGPSPSNAENDGLLALASQALGDFDFPHSA